jgi:hypothetical protein
MISKIALTSKYGEYALFCVLLPKRWKTYHSLSLSLSLEVRCRRAIGITLAVVVFECAMFFPTSFYAAMARPYVF